MRSHSSAGQFADFVEGVDLHLGVAKVAGVFDVGEVRVDSRELQIWIAVKISEEGLDFVGEDALATQERVDLEVEALPLALLSGELVEKRQPVAITSIAAMGATKEPKRGSRVFIL